MLVEKVLVESVQLGTGAASYYITTSKAYAVITQATACNTSLASVNLSVFLTPAGAAPSEANAIMAEVPIPSGQTLIIAPMVGHVLAAAGTSIQAFASAASSLTFRVSGYEKPA